MNSTALMWLIIFVASSLLFFGTAIVITIVGARDLKDLLSRSDTKK